MSYQDQIDSLVSYLKTGEKQPSDFSLGMEFEHFLLDKNSLTGVLYSDDFGVEKILTLLMEKDWKPALIEAGHLLALEKNNSTITLEPGAQVELSTPPRRRLHQNLDDYFSFLNDIVPILNEHNIFLTSIGYQPVTNIETIPFLPKKRYDYMQRYLITKGNLAHHMMKGTSSTQVSVDYSSEQDFSKKSRVINFLSPLIYCIFDNAPYKNSTSYNTRSLRSEIWDNTDPDRCGPPTNVFLENYGYSDYSEYILNTPAILYKKDDMFFSANNQKIKDIFDPKTFNRDELEYLLTMVFPDSRTKTYIEIRMGDSIPYPFTIAYAALWKGLLYNTKNLNLLYNQSIGFNKSQLDKIKKEISLNGVNSLFGKKSILETFNELLSLSMDGLDSCEKKFLCPLISLSEKGLTLKDITLNNFSQGIKKSLDWCFVNKYLDDRSLDYFACH